MDSFSFMLVSTVKVKYSSLERPKDSEIVHFMEESGIDAKEIIGFFRTNNESAFYIKFIDNACVRKSVERLKSTKYICIGERTYSTETSIVDSFTVVVQLHNLPYEISDDIVRQRLSKYEKVLDITWEEVKMNNGHNIFNGVRLVKMELSNTIPPFIYILDIKIRTYYKNQQYMCYKCNSFEHHRESCDKVTRKSMSMQSTSTIKDPDIQQELCSISADSNSNCVQKKNRKRRRRNKNKSH